MQPASPWWRIGSPDRAQRSSRPMRTPRCRWAARPGSRRRAAVRRIVLPRRGGPFLHRPIGPFSSITAEEALAHPTWRMGPKVTLDSATMLNKGLEIIEAHFLFDVPYSRIEVAIHPASVVHS